MNKIAIPALLVATVMVAGMFAFAPVEQASTVHTTDAFKDSLSEGSPVTAFSTFDASEGAVIVDVTGFGELESIHIAAVLLVDESVNDDDGVACEADDLPVQSQVLAGNAAIDVWDLVGEGLIVQTGIAVLDAAGNTDDLCIFHGTFDLDDILALADGSGFLGATDPDQLTSITDIVYLSDSLVADIETVTVTATLIQ